MGACRRELEEEEKEEGMGRTSCLAVIKVQRQDWCLFLGLFSPPMTPLCL